MISKSMKTGMVAIAAVAFIAGAAAGYGYSWWSSEKYYANDRIDRLHRQSAQKVKTYTRLLQLTRGGDTDRAIIYLEALLNTDRLILSLVLDEFPDHIQSSAGKDALKHMDEYRNEYPQE